MSVYTNVKSGFALLLSIVIISIILAIGLSMLDITLKQLTLSGTIRDSETAIHVAQSALECFRNERKDPVSGDPFLSSGAAPNMSGKCSSSATISGTPTSAEFSVSGGTVYKYVYKFDWELGEAGTADNACSETSLYHIDAETNGSDIIYSLTNEGLYSISCKDGRTCTAIFSRGFNRPCSEINSSIRTVQREMTFKATHDLIP